MRRMLMCGLVALLAPGCAFEAVSYPVEEVGPPRPAVCDRPPVADVCFEIEQLAHTELAWAYLSEQEALNDEPLGRLRIDPEGRLRYELVVTARGEDVASVREHYHFFLTGRMNEWRRAAARPPWDLRLVSRPKAFETGYEILLDLTPRGREVGIEAVITTALPAKAIAGAGG